MNQGDRIDHLLNIATGILDVVVPGVGAAVRITVQIGRICLNIKNKCDEVKVLSKSIGHVVPLLNTAKKLLEKLEETTDGQLDENVNESVQEFYKSVVYLNNEVDKIARLTPFLQVLSVKKLEIPVKRATQNLENLKTVIQLHSYLVQHDQQQLLKDMNHHLVVAQQKAINVDYSTQAEYLNNPAVWNNILQDSHKLKETYAAMLKENKEPAKFTAEENRLFDISTNAVSHITKGMKDLPKPPSWFVTEDQFEYDAADPGVQGGEGIMFRGVWGDQSPVAIKRMLRPLSNEELKEFHRTMEIWNGLRNEHIVQMYGASFYAQPAFVVSELCDHKDLVHFLQADEERRSYAMELLCEAAKGLNYMHHKQIVHGDMKGSNILVNKDWRAKLCDFDMSFKLGTRNIEDISKVKQTEAYYWMAPELFDRDQLPSLESDVYSFGLTVYETMTGQTPYRLMDFEEVKSLKQSGQLPPRARQLTDDSVWQLIGNACHLNPSERPKISQVMRRLEGILQVKNGNLPASSRRSSAAQSTPLSPVNRILPEIKEALTQEATPPVTVADIPAIEESQLLSPVLREKEDSSENDDDETSPPKSLIRKLPSREPRYSIPTLHVISPEVVDASDDENTSVKSARSRERRESRKVIAGVIVAFVLIGGILAAFFVMFNFSNVFDTNTGDTAKDVKMGSASSTTSRGSDDTSSSSGADVQDCLLSDWTDWDKTRCQIGGSGLKTRSRSVLRQPTNGGERCGSLTQELNCDAVDCEMSSWSSWDESGCKAGGSGVKSRSRTIKTKPRNDGRSCEALSEKTKCDPVDCKISEIWSSWRDCSVDTWRKKRTRSIISQAMFGGKACESIPEETADCGTVGTYVGPGEGLNQPQHVCFDPSGNLFISDMKNHVIRKVDKDGYMSIFAGTLGEDGDSDGHRSSAKFSYPMGIAFDSQSNMYVADAGNHVIRKIEKSNGTVTTFAGMGVRGYLDGSTVKFNSPVSLAFDSTGDLYVSDMNNHMIRKINMQGHAGSTFAGTGRIGEDNQYRTASTFSFPRSIVFDSSDNLYVADTGNSVIRKVEAVSGVVSTFTTSLPLGTDSSLVFGGSPGLAIDRNNKNLFISYPTDNMIDRIDLLSGATTKFTGTGDESQLLNDERLSANFRRPNGLVFDAEGSLFVADTGNNAIRRISMSKPLEPIDCEIDPTGTWVEEKCNPRTWSKTRWRPILTKSRYGGEPCPKEMLECGTVETYFASYSSDDHRVTEKIQVDSSGNLYFYMCLSSTCGTYKITSKDQASYLTSADLSMLALSPTANFYVIETQIAKIDLTTGQTTPYYDNFEPIGGLAFDPTTWELYFTDKKYGVIRKIDLKTKSVTTLDTTVTRTNKGGIPTIVNFGSFQRGKIVFDSKGNLFLMEPDKIHKLPAGEGNTFEEFYENTHWIVDMAVDKYGNLYVASDDVKHVVRRFNAEGEEDFLFGTTEGYVDGPLISSKFSYPWGLGCDLNGNIFVTDALWANNGKGRIRKISPT